MLAGLLTSTVALAVVVVRSVLGVLLTLMLRHSDATGRATPQQDLHNF